MAETMKNEKKKQKKNESKPNQTEPEMLECHCMSASSSMQAPSHRKRERIKREKKEDAKYVHFCWLLFLFLFGSHHNSHVFIQLASNQQAEIPHRGTNQRSASFLAMVCTFFASTDDDPFYFRGVRVLSFKHF